MNFKTFYSDRPFIENKYHDTKKEFNPYSRMSYHGWNADENSGLSVDDIKRGLFDVEKLYENCSHEVRKARAIEYVLQNTRIDCNEHDYFPLVYTWNREIKETTVDKWKSEMYNQLIPETTPTYNLFNESGVSNMWPDFDHVVPDWDSVLSLGFIGLKARANEYKNKLLDKYGSLTPSQIAYFDGIEIEYGAIVEFISRLYDLASKKSHEKAQLVASSLHSLVVGSPKNTFEAMLAIYLYFIISESIDHYQVRSLGNGLDNTLLSFYQNDIKNGIFTRDEIKEFFAYFLMQWSAIGNYWGQPLYLGGTNKDGSTKINNLSYDIIEVYSHLGIYNPKIQIKYSQSLPTDFLNMILTDISKSKGSYVFCCEQGMIKAIRSYGASEEEARNYDIRGCYETGVRSKEVSTAGAYINAVKVMEYVFSNGFDKRINKQVGILSGEIDDFKTFDDFYHAYLNQLDYITTTSMNIVYQFEKYLGYVNPSSMYSATITHSLERGVDAYQNGVKFCNSAELLCGFASAVDSLLAVKELVYDKKIVTLKELKTALDNDWVGYEVLRKKAQNCKKYGNGDEIADGYAEALAKYYALKVANTPNSRGGVYKPIMHSAMQFVSQGKKTLATPDGRKAGDENSKNASPSVGADKNGATALILSALKLNPTLYTESFCLDVMLHPSATQGEEGLIAMKGLLDVYSKGDGQSIQFNVFNSETLRDAQKHPEKYENLQVRVCGWNVLWNNLPKDQQDAYILRAENIAQ